MSDDDEIEIVCVRVLFSSFAPFLRLQKKQKNSHQNAVVLDFNLTGRGINFCLTETKKE